MTCERCQKSPATTHQEYRESSDDPTWKNQVTKRCADCAKSLREYIAVMPSFTLVLERPLETSA